MRFAMRGRTSHAGFRALLVNHAEKGVFGLAALMGLATLGMSRWSHFDGTPDQITEKVRKSKTELEARTWPAEERQQFLLTRDQLPAQLVYENLRRPYRPEGFPFPMEFSTRFVHSLTARRQPLKEPVLVRLDQPLATAGRVLVQKAPPLATSAETPRPNARTPAEAPGAGEFLPDELRPPGHTARTARGNASGVPWNPLDAAPDLRAGTYPVRGDGGRADLPMPTVAGEGHHYVAVRAVFPVKDQIRKFAEAIQRPFGEAARAFDIIDFQLERQELASSTDQKWSDWATVDRAAAEQVLTSSDGFDPEVIAAAVTNSVMTMPLPKRVFGQWFTDVTHPALEKFQLSEDEIGEQLEYHRKLLSRYLETQKSQRPPRIPRKGFAPQQFDSREVQAEFFGGGATYEAPFAGSTRPISPGPTPLGSRLPAAMSPARMGAGRQGLLTPEEMMKRLGSANPKDADKALVEFIRTRATVDGELLLFRYIDFAVEPGKTYRYRVRLELINPNFGRQPSEANGEATVVQGETRTSKWSDVTEPAYVKPDVDYFVASVEMRKSIPQARLNMFQWDSKLGTVVQGAIDACVGQLIAGRQRTEVIDPPNGRIETQDYAFVSKDFLVDAAGDSRLDAKYHSDLKFATSRGDLGLPARVLVADAAGCLHGLDSLRSGPDEKKARKYMDDQSSAFRRLREMAAQAAEGGGLGPMILAPSAGGLDSPGNGNRKNTMRRRPEGVSGGGSGGSAGSSSGHPGDSASSGPAGGTGRHPSGSGSRQ